MTTRKKKVEAPVVEAEFEEVVPPAPEAPVEEKAGVKCAIHVGMTAEGDMFFDITGTDQNLPLVDGVLKYAERNIDRIWEERLTAIRNEQ